jgi:hypothetical protein
MSIKYESPHPAISSILLLLQSSIPKKRTLHRILFSKTLSLCYYLNVRGQVSQPYKTTGRIIVLYILTFTFLDSRQEDKRL